ncbi:helix-turn-helix transcriptional regulator [Tsukamurella pseudospumae]|nr:helix-turn-helix transcriptional regulator [Tsukamurella pseudospumae]
MVDGRGGAGAGPRGMPITTFTVVGIPGVEIPLSSFGGEIDVPAAAAPSELIGAAIAQVSAARPARIVVLDAEHLDPLSTIVVRRLRQDGHRIVERSTPRTGPRRAPAVDADLVVAAEILAVAGTLPAVLRPQLIDEEHLRRLRAAQILGPGDPLRLADPHVAQRLLEGMGIAARRLRAGQVVRAAQAAAGLCGPADTRHVIWMADLMTRADAGCIDVDVLTAGAAAAATMGEPHLGRRLAEFAADHGGGLPARLQLAAAAAWTGDGAAVESALAGLDVPGAPPELRSFCAFVGAGSLAWNDGRIDAARTLLQQRRDELGEHPDAALLDATIALLRYFEGDLDGALALADPLLDNPSPVAVVWAASAAAAARAAHGESRAAEAAISVGLAAARRCDSGVQRFMLAVAAADAAIADGDPGRALRRGDDFDRLAAGAPHASAVVAVARGRALLAAGRPEAARAAFEEALIAMEGMPRGWQSVAGAGLAQALGELGRHGESASALGRAEAQQLDGMQVYRTDLGLARAWSFAARGDVERAVDAARAALEDALAQGHREAELRSRLTLARLGDRGTAPSSTVHPPGGPVGAGLVAGFARALRSRAPGALLEAGRRLHAAGMASAAADAQAWAAVEYTRAGDGPAATAALASVCSDSDLRTPARWAAQMRCAGLSAKERHVARELARGGETRELATRLGVSIRTVEGHVYHLLAKLGVSNRTELVDALPWRETET